MQSSHYQSYRSTGLLGGTKLLGRCSKMSMTQNDDELEFNIHKDLQEACTRGCMYSVCEKAVCSADLIFNN